MTLDEAIIHCEDVANSKCDKCGEEHRQLAEWLKELKQTRQVIEDIKHEIRKYLEDGCINENEAEGIMFCLDVMDKHIGKETDNE